MEHSLEKRAKVESKSKWRIKYLGTDWILFRVESLQAMIEEVNKVLEQAAA